MSFIKLKLICLAILFSFFTSHAQEKQKMNINDLLKFALQNNYDLKEAHFNKVKSEFSIKETRANGLPKIEGDIEYKDYLKLASIILPGALAGTDQDIIAQFGKKYNLDASLQVSQLLFSLKYINGLKTTKKLAEIRALEVEKAESELYQLLHTEYYNLLAIYKNLKIIESNMESLKLTRQKISAMVKGGLTLQTDLDKIDINYANLEANKEQIRSGITIQTNNLKYIIGMQPDVKLEIDTAGFKNLFREDLFLDKYASSQFDPDNLIDIQILNRNVELNDYQIKSAKAELTPTISLFGSYMYQAQRNKFNFFDANKDWFKVNVVGVKATIPIFSGFGNKAKISSAKIDKEITLNNKRKATEGFNVQYQNSLMAYQSNIKTCLIQVKNVELAERVKKQENLKYEQGISSLTDFLISIADYRNARINYVQNFIAMKKSEIDLLKTQGLLRTSINQSLQE